MTFDEAILEKKLQHVSNSQDSIQGLSLWILHYRLYYRKIIDVWCSVLEQAKMSHRLTLFYLANDVVQNAKKKNVPNYVSGFAPAFQQVMVYLRDGKIQPNVTRVLKIWQERGVYDKGYIMELLSILSGSLIPPAMPTASTIVAEFKLQSLVEPIHDLKELEAKSKISSERLNSEMIKSLSTESLSRLKDKSHGEQIIRECDEATSVLDSEIRNLELETVTRTKLLEHLKTSQIFYETQREESMIVANAYQNFSLRVTAVQKKLSQSKYMKQLSIPLPPEPCPPVDGSMYLPNEMTSQQRATYEEHKSSLDQRLSSLMQGMAGRAVGLDVGNAFGLGQTGPNDHQPEVILPPTLQNIFQPPASSSHVQQRGSHPNLNAPYAHQHQSNLSRNQNQQNHSNNDHVPPTHPNNIYHNTNLQARHEPLSQSSFHHIQSVISARGGSAMVPQHIDHAAPLPVSSPYAHYANPNLMPLPHRENFEPADMDLGGNSDEEHDMHHHDDPGYVPTMPRTNNLKVIDTQKNSADQHYIPSAISNDTRQQQYVPSATAFPLKSSSEHRSSLDEDWRARSQMPRSSVVVPRPPGSGNQAAYHPQEDAFPIDSQSQSFHQRKMRTNQPRNNNANNSNRRNNNYSRY